MVRSEKRPRRVQETEETDSDVVHTDTERDVGEEHAEPSRRKSRAATPSDQESESDEDSPSTVGNSLCGLIKKLKVSNFMCHELMEVEFGKNVNFIVGENGSGKSAVLTSIILGLGGAIGIAGRGSKKASVIKHGKPQADVVIELYNEGCDAYKPELYGDLITIETTIRKTHTDIKLKGALQKKLISTSKKDLQEITDQFNIQVDNPVAVLNQDMSKSFFQATKATKKYQLFMKATQMDLLTNTHKSTMEQHVLIEGSLPQLTANQDQAERELKEAEAEYNKTTRLQKMQARVNALRVELVIAGINQTQGKLENTKENLVDREAKADALKENLEEKLAVLESQDGKEKEIVRAIEALSKQIEENTKNAASLQSLKKAWKKIQKQRQQKETAKKKIEREVETIKRRIEQEKEAAEQDYQSQLTQRDQNSGNVRGKEDELSRVQKMLGKKEEEMRRLYEDRNQYSEKFEGQREAVTRSNDEVKAAKADIADARRASTDPMAVFGPGMKQVLQKIGKCKWSEKPIGPLAKHVKLTDPRFQAAVNYCCGNMFKSFVVFSQADQAQLVRIFREVYKGDNRKTPNIFYTKKEPRFTNVNDYPKDLKGQLYDTVDSAISVTHDQVWNMLIVHARIHRNIVMEDQKRADQLAFRDKFHTGQVTVWSGSDGDTINIDMQGNPTSMPGRLKGDWKNYLVDDVSDEVDRLTVRLRQVEQRHNQVKTAASRAQQDFKQADGQLKVANREVVQLQKSEQKLEAEINKLRDSLGDVDEPELQATQTEHFEEDISQKMEEIEELSQECTQLTQNELQERKKEKPLEAKVNEITAKLGSLGEEDANLHADLDHVLQFKQKLDRKINKVRKATADTQAEINDFRADVTIIQKELDYNRAEFDKQGLEWQDVAESLESLTKELISKENIIEKEKKKAGGVSIEQVKTRFVVAQGKFDEAATHHTDAIKMYKILKKFIAQRLETLEHFREHVGKRASKHFKQTIAKKDYEGRMKLDHSAQELNITVDVTGVDSKKESSDGLSGGEKSWTTSCFIVALWEAMETPFRCLDEFDVFMDSMNREMAIQMMIDVAQSQPDRQFIYLSPLGMKILNKYNNDDGVKVIRFKKQLDGQQALGFQPIA